MIIEDKIYIQTESLGRHITELCELFTYSNPEFYQKKALKLSTKDIARSLTHYRFMGDGTERTLVLPRGGIDKVREFYKKIGMPFRVLDKRVERDRIDCGLNPNTVLEPQQLKIIETLLKNNGGLIQMDVAGGKTISILGFLDRIKQPTLILFNRHQLKGQWLSEIEKRMVGSFSIGDYSEGKLIHGDIVLGLTQTIHRVVDEDKSFLDRFGALVVDECLDGDTFIDTLGGVQRLKNLNVDDIVITPNRRFSRITKINKVTKEAIKFNLAGGSFLIASADHKVPIMEYDAGKVVLQKIGDVDHLLLNKRPYNIKDSGTAFDRNLYLRVPIAAREQLGKRELYDITIDDKDHLITANGIAVSNCHRVTSETYLKIVNNIPALYRVGVTATVKRKDERHILIYDVMGPVRTDITANELKHRITAFNYRLIFTDSSFKFPTRKRWTGHTVEEVKDHTAMLSMLVRDKDRNDLIIDTLDAFIRDGHFVLVLSDRVQHNRDLYKRAVDMGFEAELIVGSSRKYDWDSIRGNKHLNVIFATTSLASEGLDIPRLSALFLTCPSSNMPQLKQKTGRIRRQFEGKPLPIVVDFIDDKVYHVTNNDGGEEIKTYPLRGSGLKREKFYKTLIEEYSSGELGNEANIRGGSYPEQEIQNQKYRRK